MINWQRVGLHMIFWVFASSFIWLFISSNSPDELLILKFVALLMPITIATSYAFNYLLIEKKLLKRKYLQFVLYGLFTFIFSIYLQAVLVTLAFISLANYSYDNMGPVAGNVMYLGVSTYFIIFLSALIFLFKKSLIKKDNEQLKGNTKVSTLKVTSERKVVVLNFSEIIYVESLSNYVRIHTITGNHITKQKISKLEKDLPENFIRIHRSFIVNLNFVNTFSKESLQVKDITLNISRTYKQNVLEKLA